MSFFKDLPLFPEIQKNLDAMGITTPTAIQQQAIPKLLETIKIDFHGQAQTGTGKTFAFGIPLLQKIDRDKRTTQALIVAPTRELVLQICDSLKGIARGLDIVIDPIYGGMPMERQISALKKGVHIVVGTPGRLNDHLNRKTLVLKDLRTLVLDEADIMLDMGFKEEVDQILEYAPKDRQIWLFSATVKQGIADIKRNHMSNVVTVSISKTQVTTSTTKQFYCVAPSKYKFQAMCRFIDSVPAFYGFVFAQTKILASELADQLIKRGYSANALHGDMSQSIRNEVIKKFKRKDFTILVATDVASRGIDVVGLTHVVNYSLPEDQESYVHRIGRTGRAGQDGTAITFIGRNEGNKLKSIARMYQAEILPLEVPSIETILGARANKALEYFIAVTAEGEHKMHPGYETLRAALATHSHDELINGLAKVLSDQFCKEYAAEQDIQFGAGPEAVASDSRFKELELSVGEDDGVSKEDVTAFLLESGMVQQHDIVKIRVIKRRSFITLPGELTEKLVNELRGKSLNGNRVRVFIARDNGFAGGSDRGGERSERPERRSYDRGDRGGERSGGERSGGDRGGDRKRFGGGGHSGGRSSNGGGERRRSSYGR